MTDKNGRRNKVAALRERHRREMHLLVRGALRTADWNLAGAAELLGVPASTLQWIVEHDEELQEERVRRRPESLSRRTGRPAEA